MHLLLHKPKTPTHNFFEFFVLKQRLGLPNDSWQISDINEDYRVYNYKLPF